MYKYLRKIFLLTSLPRLFLILKKNPVFLIEFLNLFNQPILHKFNEPLTKKEIFDTNDALTKFIYFVFFKNTSYSKFKQKKKGRVKRKISRKLVLKNALID
jgi:hypothetical protein